MTLSSLLASLLPLFGAGLLTFASPCVLPMLPVYLSVLGGAEAAGAEQHARRGAEHEIPVADRPAQECSDCRDSREHCDAEHTVAAEQALEIDGANRP